MRRVAYLCGAGAVACALFVLCSALTACGGGNCDESCKHISDQANGRETVQPVDCAASGACE